MKFLLLRVGQCFSRAKALNHMRQGEICERQAKIFLAGMADAGEADAGGGALSQNLSAEAEQLGWTSAGLRIELRCPFNHAACFYQPAKVLFVQP
jgi:hypothetical protein